MSENQSSSQPNLLLIGGGIIVVLALAIAGYFMLNSNGDQATSSVEPSASVTSPYLISTSEFGNNGGFGTGLFTLDKVEGRADAPVTIIEYASWTCPACRAFHATDYKNSIKPAIEAGHVKFVTRDLLRNAIDFRATLAARCEGVDFVEATDLLFNNQPAYSVNSMEQVDAALIQILSPVGMDVQKYAACLTDTDMGNFVKAVSDDASSRRINVTPTIFVNGNRVGDSDRQDFGAFLTKQIERATN